MNDKKRKNKSESIKSRYSCDQYTNVFTRKTELDEHKESHPMFKCDQCDEIFF